MKFRRVASREPRFPGLMKNKKGFIRILEAVFAILVIMGAALILISNSVQTSDISEEVYEKQRYILDVVTNNQEMRNEIIDYNPEATPPRLLTKTTTFIQKNIPSTWTFKTCITDIDKICNEETPDDKDLYVSEAIISSSLTKYDGSKKLRFFIWRK